ncbi:MAG: uroporphyrinogen-III C-methyltransferase [Leadbetterella sp.]
MAKLTLVGAGPGDAELITLKGIKAIENADVILYDALASGKILDYAKENCLILYVGKRKGDHYLKQSEINELIVNYAQNHEHIVRLKGGDPFVFGRGFEEIEYAEAHGMTTEVIPGVSSSIGVLGANKIPITHRQMAQSFWVVTGHTQDEKLPEDMKLAAQSTATVVILMGMSKLSEIVDLFKKYKKGNLPAAIFMNGSTEEQKHAIGTLDTILDKAQKNELKNPSIIVFGEVVSLYKNKVNELVTVLNKTI